MEATAHTRQARRHLRQLAAILWALAGLARCAAGRAAPVRVFVLWLLGMAETVAGDHLVWVTGGALARRPLPARSGRDAVAARRLAARLYALAAALAAFVPRMAAARQANPRRSDARQAHPLCMAHALPVPAAGRLDSS